MERQGTEATRNILILGATGTQGTGVMEAFQQQLNQAQAKQWRLKALTRNANDAKAKKLREMDKLGIVDLVEGDICDLDRMRSIMKGCHGLCIILQPAGLAQDWDTGVKREAELGRKLVDLAAESGIKHLVYSSVGGADRNTGISHFDSKWQVEQQIRKKGEQFQYWSIVRPVYFFNNLEWSSKDIKSRGVLRMPVPRDCRLQGVANETIGHCIAKCFLSPQSMNHIELELADDDLAMSDWARALNCTFEQQPLQEVQSKDMRDMYAWFAREGYKADIQQCKKLIPQSMDLRTWAQKHGLVYQGAGGGSAGVQQAK